MTSDGSRPGVAGAGLKVTGWDTTVRDDEEGIRDEYNKEWREMGQILVRPDRMGLL